MVDAILQFLDAGGEVLYLIAFLTFLLWTLAVERFWYFSTALRLDVATAVQQWEARGERKSQAAHRVRLLLISRVKLLVEQNLPLLRSIVSLCPMVGLLGTVWGMIEVFNVMAMTGGGEVRAMASGVSKATIPTMAGMVAAISGVFANTLLTRMAERRLMLLEDSLTMDH